MLKLLCPGDLRHSAHTCPITGERKRLISFVKARVRGFHMYKFEGKVRGKMASPWDVSRNRWPHLNNIEGGVSSATMLKLLNLFHDSFLCLWGAGSSMLTRIISASPLFTERIQFHDLMYNTFLLYNSARILPEQEETKESTANHCQLDMRASSLTLTSKWTSLRL